MKNLLPILPYWSVPALFVAACIILLLIRNSKWRKSSLYGILAFVLFLLFGGYSILQSRSSTSGIGFIFLPVLALLPGSIGFLLGRIHTDYLQRKQSNKPVVLQGSSLVILLLLMMIPFIWQADALFDTISKNNLRDRETARQRQAINNNTKQLANLLTENPGREVDILWEKLRETEDRTELIPIAKNSYASSELLNELSKSSDFGVVLTVVRNRNTHEDTLKWIYTSHAYPSYFYTALSSHPKTPKNILGELYDKRHQNTGIALQLARNPELPDDILNKLTTQPEKYVLRNILDREELSCEQVNKVVNTIKELKDSDIDRLIEKSKNRIENCIRSNQP